MIDLTYSNGSVFVWNVDDVYRLRKDYRIVGNFIGCLPSLPRQDQMLGLPMQLTSEQIHFLLKRNVARVVRYEELDRPVGEEARKRREEAVGCSYLEQSVLYREERLSQLMKISKKIVEGKRKKYGSDNFDEKLALQEEIDRIPPMSKDMMMVQIPTRPHWQLEGEELANEILISEKSTKNLVFNDLWEKGYYLTSGEKFGGDFLVYPGDPLKFHSHYIAVCVDEDEPLTPQFLISKGRLGTNVKKIVLLCSIDSSGIVNYQSLQWVG